MEDKKRITFEIIYEIAISYLAKFYVTKKCVLANNTYIN